LEHRILMHPKIAFVLKNYLSGFSGCFVSAEQPFLLKLSSPKATNCWPSHLR
jgi:hypothetical protein